MLGRIVVRETTLGPLSRDEDEEKCQCGDDDVEIEHLESLTWIGTWERVRSHEVNWDGKHLP